MMLSVVTALFQAAPHFYKFYRQAVEGSKNMNGE
jgi:hypothetical protein